MIYASILYNTYKKIKSAARTSYLMFSNLHSFLRKSYGINFYSVWICEFVLFKDAF